MVDKNIRVCCGMTCAMRGARNMMKKIEDETGVKAGEKVGDTDLGYCQCVGYCHAGPNVAVNESLIVGAKESTIMHDIDEAMKGNVKTKIHVTDADLNEILNNDFLGDL